MTALLRLRINVNEYMAPGSSAVKVGNDISVSREDFERTKVSDQDELREILASVGLIELDKYDPIGNFATCQI